MAHTNSGTASSGVYSANHADLAGPYYNAMNQYIPRGRKDAQSFFQCPGINMDCEIFHWGQSTSGVGDQGQRSNAALAAVPFANHWLWTRDVAWLRDVGWQCAGSHGLHTSSVPALSCLLQRTKAL